MNNLHLYHKLVKQLCQWLPDERITRIRNGALLIAGLYLGQKVHLGVIARKLPVVGQLPSLVNRLRRFVDNDRMDVRTWYEPVIRPILQARQGQPIELIMDCTKVGFAHRMLMVALAYRSRALPMAWQVFEGAKGHVSHPAQLTLLKYVARLLPAGSSIRLLADAGFESVQVMRWLRQQGWHFVIRLPGRNQVSPDGEHWTKLNALPLSRGETRVLGWMRLTAKHNLGWFWVVCHWDAQEDEPWFLVADQPGSLPRLYAKRMWIEEMFGDLKGHGFDLEATHLADVDRLSRLIWAVCVTFVWLLTCGSWVVKNGLRSQVDLKSRRDKSYFRLGWDWIERCFALSNPLPFRFVLYV